MGKTTETDLINALESLLEREKQALIQGDLETVGQLISQKEDIFSQINDLDDTQRDRLTDLHEKVTRNQALLNSALDGIRAVANRMADLRRVRASFETYDHTGQRQKYGVQTHPKVEKRA